MLSYGFVFALYPVLKRLYPDRAERTEAVKRHLTFFNAQPYFASFALGAVARLEQEAKMSGRYDAELINRFKSRLGSMLGSMGDQMFWGHIRPTTVLLGVFVSLLWGYWGALVFLISFNFFHLVFRFRGFFSGYERGLKVIQSLTSTRLSRLDHNVRVAGVCLLGFTVPLLVFTFGDISPHTLTIFACSFTVGMLNVLVKWRLPSLVIFATIIAAVSRIIAGLFSNG